MSEASVEPGSFRDRQGRVFYENGRVYRALSETAMDNWRVLAQTRFFQEYVKQGSIIPTRHLEAQTTGLAAKLADEWAGILEHQAIPFISYPYEWSFGMLKDAALLQLELMQAALQEAMTMKDASSFNVQWQGTSPVFIDLPSFEPCSPGEPWAGYRQFCELCLYPLQLQAYKGVSFQQFLRGNIDGIPVQTMAHLMTGLDRLKPGVLTHVVLQAKMQNRFANTDRRVRKDLQHAGFSTELVKNNVKRLQRLVEGLHWRQVSSEWSEYSERHNYSQGAFAQKTNFVERNVASRQWGLVWDIGCNTGQFSLLAARHADYVLAMDADHLAVERLYQQLREKNNRTVLPLVMNLADPSAALGWRAIERKTITERGLPDLVLSLALIHHMVIGANIPMREFIDWLGDLGGSLIIEFVTKRDPMVEILLRNKEDIYDDYDLGFFEQCLGNRFRIKDREVVEGETRVLFFAQPK